MGRVGLVCCLCAVPMAVAAQSPPRVEALRERATAYVEDFLARFSQIVCEEHFVQESNSLPSVSGTGTNQKMDAPAPGRREIRSDYLFVRRQASDDWMTFRDTFEVDGRPVRDRGDRLVKLLANPSLENEALARRLTLERTRHQLDPGVRSVNDPLLALVFLQARYQARFRYTRGARDRQVGEDVWIVDFQEQDRPTLVRVLGGDAPSRGRLWIEAGNGRVLKSEMQVTTSRVVTTFAWDEAIGLAVPVEMRDDYTLGRTDYRATATYSRFRRFDVSTSEKVQEP
ncbi:MAG TPA: hypothetical protein VFD69_09105 [Vicinamibacterales bacterium]|nr:hypothetical protein [Vicinamibacterales bacterium]